MNKEKISALINLLDDPDDSIFEQVTTEIKQIGYPIIPVLENAWDTSFDVLLQERIEQLIHQIQFDRTITELQSWKASQDKNLLEAALLIAQYQYADINKEEINDFFKKLYNDIWIELNSNLTALEKIGVVNKVFFEMYGFKGNKKNYYSPINSFINQVVESKKGSPISISIILIEVARRLKIPIYGVNLPEHYILCYTHLPIEYLDEVTKEDVLFYINPFQGILFQGDDIKKYLDQLKIDDKEKFYLPCNNLTTIKRLLKNLIFSYSKLGYKEKVEEVKLMLEALD